MQEEFDKPAMKVVFRRHPRAIREVADALGLTPATIYQWFGPRGGSPRIGVALQKKITALLELEDFLRSQRAREAEAESAQATEALP